MLIISAYFYIRKRVKSAEESFRASSGSFLAWLQRLIEQAVEGQNTDTLDWLTILCESVCVLSLTKLGNFKMHIEMEMRNFPFSLFVCIFCD